MITLSQKIILRYSLLTLCAIMAIAAFILYRLIQFNNGYHQLPKEKDQLFKYVKPKYGIEYWTFLTINASGEKINTTYEYGNLPKEAKIKCPHRSLFNTNVMVPVYQLIVYLDHGNLKYVTDYNTLKDFIGAIDNMQEALLIAYSLGFSYTNEYGTGYREVNQAYEFVLNRVVSTCPYTQEKTFLRFNKYGITKIEKRHTDVSKGCIMF